MKINLKNKNVLITGAAKGVGRELSLAIAENGANVALHYRESEQEAIQLVKEIERLGVHATSVQGDLANYDEVKSMKEKLGGDFGHIDMIVNNAGWAQMKGFFEYEPEEWKREVDVCFYGVLNLVYEFVPSMKDNHGKFINIVGDSARTGDRNLIVSAAARNGAISFLKSLAKEVGRSNVQCNTISLGLIDQGEFDESIVNKIVKQYPSRRLGTTSDVVGAVLFMLSDEANWITGQVLSVNGGHSMIG
ncbi:SDR family NAD(P)-dependent oxidoreductase [Oceanobacillus senegalensis]|uniref:SDR family NAD(P)-dependent oxidoreductase n=1 Tax=Oceanobacillus senegalensis TaxID=1936063 RepID=UPI000A313E85|nr:SDR family oxidoreductase [Oceanobacillus senegalensis]